MARTDPDGPHEYQRFWSMTAYTPEYIELVPNAPTYVVASYTPGLVTAKDGSVTIYVQADQPETNTDNWLPVPKGHFSLLFRVYGPLGSALAARMSRPRSTAPSRKHSGALHFDPKCL